MTLPAPDLHLQRIQGLAEEKAPRSAVRLGLRARASFVIRDEVTMTVIIAIITDDPSLSLSVE